MKIFYPQFVIKNRIIALFTCVISNVIICAQDVQMDLRFPQADGNINDVVADSLSNRVYLCGSFTNLAIGKSYGLLIDTTTRNIDTTFPAPNGSVLASIPDGNGGWYIGGNFTHVDGLARGRLAQIDATGQVTSFFSGNDDFFDGTVRSLATHGSKLYVGGDFTQASKGRANGAWLDTATGAAIPQFPTVNGLVNRSVVDKNNGWFISGTFSQVNGVSRTNIAQVDSAGNLTSFNVAVDGQILAMTIANDTLFIAGQLISVGGQPRTRTAAIHISTNTVLPQFNISLLSGSIQGLAAYGSKLYATGGFSYATDSIFRSLAVFDLQTLSAIPSNISASSSITLITATDGAVFIGGQFQEVNGVSRLRLAKVDTATLSLDGWIGNLNGIPIGLTSEGNKIYVVGSFTQANSFPTGNFAAIHTSTGAPDATNIAVLGSGSISNVAICGNKIFVSGSFRNINSQVRARIAAIDKSTGAISTWEAASSNPIQTLSANNYRVFIGGQILSAGGIVRQGIASLGMANGQISTWAPQVAGSVYDIEPLQNGVFIGGSFSSINHIPFANLNIIDTATAVAGNFDYQVNNTVRDILIQGSTMYIAGAFTSVRGTSNTRLAARINLSNNVLEPLNNIFNPSGSGHALAIHNNILYLGGSFNIPNRNNLIAYSITTGTLLPLFIGASSILEVNTLKVVGNKLFIGGMFSEIMNTPRSNFGAINIDTHTLDTNWILSLNGTVHCINAQDQNIYIGGSFNGVTNQAPIGRFAAIDAATGQILQNWTPNFVGIPRRIVLKGSTVLIGGGFTSVDSVARQNLAALDSLGNLLPFNASTNNSVELMAVYNDTLLIAGSFTSVNGTPRNRFAAVQISTGQLLPFNINASMTGTNVLFRSMIIENDILYIAGRFDTISNQPREELAAIDLTNGSLTPWYPNFTVGSVFALTSINGVIYLGGNNINPNNQPNTHLQPVNSAGVALASPISFNGIIRSMKSFKDELMISGNFSTANGNLQERALIYNINTGMYQWQTHIQTSSPIMSFARINKQFFLGGSFAINDGSNRQNFAAYNLCYPGDTPMVSIHDTTICPKAKVQLYVQQGQANEWHWFEGSCSGNPIYVGDTLVIHPTSNTTYFVQGLLDCERNTSCDSVVVHVEQVNTNVIQTSAISFIADAFGASYQWVDCNNGYAPIVGATQQSFNAPSNGSFAAIVTENGCADTSECFTVTSFHVVENFNNVFVVYPNPAQNTINIALLNSNQKYNYTIVDLYGRTLRSGEIKNQKTELNIQSLSQGSYILTLFNEDGISRQNFTKID